MRCLRLRLWRCRASRAAGRAIAKRPTRSIKGARAKVAAFELRRRHRRTPTQAPEGAAPNPAGGVAGEGRAHSLNRPRANSTTTATVPQTQRAKQSSFQNDNKLNLAAAAANLIARGRRRQVPLCGRTVERRALLCTNAPSRAAFRRATLARRQYSTGRHLIDRLLARRLWPTCAASCPPSPSCRRRGSGGGFCRANKRALELGGATCYRKRHVGRVK